MVVFWFFLWFFVFVGGAIALAYRRVSLGFATLYFGVALICYTVIFGGAPTWWKALLWLIYLALAVSLNVLDFRREWLSKPVCDFFRKVFPEMSPTEQAALEAGGVWWDGDLFSGAPNWEKFAKIPTPRISREEQAFLDGPVERLCEMLDEWEITHKLGDLPPKVWKFLKDEGFFAMIIPAAYGGREFSALANSEVLVRIASRSPTCASIVSVPNSLGPAELLMRYGTDVQKDHYLPRLASGEEVPCFALTGPEAGSDAASIPDSGIVCKGMWKGEETLGMRLNWDKRYITLAPIATVLGLAFKLYDPEHLMGEQDAYGITCALIPPDLPGINIGRRHFPLNIPFQNGPTKGEDVFVPIDFIIGGPKMAGQGWVMLMECLAAGRSISLPSNATGSAKLAVFASGAYARIRKQFRVPIAEFEGIDEVLGRMGGTLYAMDATRVMTAGARDQGEVPAVPSGISKYHVTEMARAVTNDAMDIHGGKGIQLGPRNYLARAYESVPIAITVEGANILTRNLMIFGQGALRCHPYVLREMRATQESDAECGLADFDRAFFAHIGFTLSNAARAFTLGLTGARIAEAPSVGSAKPYYQQVSRLSAAFALAADAAMLVLGGALKKREKISARLGDVLSYLYITSAVLKRFEDQGRPVEDLPLVEWACEDALFKLETQLAGLLRNFPNRAVAMLLNFLIFPLGRRFAGPSDKLGHRVAQLLSVPSDSRDRLTEGVYAHGEDTIGLMNEALKLAARTEQADKAIHVARRDGQLAASARVALIEEAKNKHIISPEDAVALQRLYTLTAEIVAVDDFNQHELGIDAKRRARRRQRRARARSKSKAGFEAVSDSRLEHAEPENPLREASG